MGRERFVTRGMVAVAVALLGALAGCADGGDVGRRDGGGALDGGGDTGIGGRDTGTSDTGGGGPDAGADAGPEPTLRTCEACTSNRDCIDGYCANLVSGGRACLPGCIADLPECPRSFSCIFDASGTGVDATICAPIGGPCCVDEDGDGYGVGVGCTDTDCNDMDEEVHPDRTEICDGRDTNCNGTVDEPPTNCEGGLCRALVDGSYEQLTSATCSAASCGMGTVTACGLYTCSMGGDEGITCASSCANPSSGADDDAFCIEAAHCEAGACVADVPNGGACNEDSDCETAHCDSDICCASGDCCLSAADCPGGGATTLLCDDPMNCQGSRGEASCSSEFRCMVMAGIADDRACNAMTEARNCGLYDPIVCTGEANQPPRACPTSCISDSDCIDAAHCTVGVCIPDLPAGGTCGRPGDCMDGLFCTDNVCCTSACGGTCQSCNLPGTAGVCTMVPPGGDPSSECAGFSCSGYYTGFGPGSDQCYRRTDVSDGVAVCDGAGACRSPDVLCPTQPPATLQIDCNDMCQSPSGGTCTGTVAGSCRNLDDPGMTTSCGTGACERTVQRCVAGAPQMCMPGPMMLESCNGTDDDCDGTPDDGSGSALCGSPPQASSVSCLSGPSRCAINMCNSGFANIDGDFDNGCECSVNTGGLSCAVAANLGSLSPGGAMSVTGAVPPGEERWFTVTFAPGARMPGGGRPRIQLTGPSAASHTLLIATTCNTADTTVCSVEGSAARSSATNNWEFFDDQAMPGAGQWSSHTTPWPTNVFIRVTRLTPAMNCADAGFTLSVSR